MRFLWVSMVSNFKSVLVIIYVILSIQPCLGNITALASKNYSFYCSFDVFDGLGEYYLACNFSVLFTTESIVFQCNKNWNISGFGVSILDNGSDDISVLRLFSGFLKCTSGSPIIIKAEFSEGVATENLALVKQNRITNFGSDSVSYQYQITVDFSLVDLAANFKRSKLVKYVVSTIERSSSNLQLDVLIEFFRLVLLNDGLCLRPIYNLLDDAGIEVTVQNTIEIPIVSLHESVYFLEKEICRGTFSNQCDEPEGEMPCFPSKNYSDIRQSLPKLFTDNEYVSLEILFDFLKIENGKIKIVDSVNIVDRKGKSRLQTVQNETEKSINVYNKILILDDLIDLMNVLRSIENKYCDSQNLIRYNEVLYLLQLLDVGEVLIGEPGNMDLNGWKGFKVETNYLQMYGSGLYRTIPNYCHPVSFPIRFKEFAASPQEENLYPKYTFYNILNGNMENDVDFLFQCSSKYDVVITKEFFNGRTRLNTTSSDVTVSSTFHKYMSAVSITILMPVSGLNFEAFSCKTRERKIGGLHDWTIWQLSYRIKYSPKYNVFFCFTDFSGEKMAIKQWKCNNRLQCQIIADNCLNKNKTLAFKHKSNEIVTPQCMESLSDVNMKTCESVGIINTLETLCFTMEPFKNGVVHCSVSSGVKLDFSVHVAYFTGLDGKLYVENEMKEPPPKDAVLKLSKLNDQQSFYVKQAYTFRCEAHLFFYENGIQWFLEFSNGSLIPLLQYNSSTTTDIGENLSEITITINDQSLQNILCFAPIFGTTLWDNTSLELTIVDSSSPKIIYPESNVYLMNDGKGQSITCQASGRPSPNIIWRTEDGSPIAKPLRILDNYTLHFPIYNETFSGTYVCTASNVAGEDVKQIHVNGMSDTPEKNSNILIAAIITPIISLFCTSLLFCFYLRKRQMKRYYELKEIIATLDGLTSEDDEDPIYHPFQMKYEMKKNSFIIDRTEKLGGGHFGVVYKGLMDTVLGSVAFKTVRFSNNEHLRALVSEIKILMYIGPHENLITLLGVYKEEINNGVLFAAIDYCKLGSLYDVLRDNKYLFSESLREDYLKIKSDYISEDPSLLLYSIESILKWLGQIANGMEFLATKKVVHSDLATRNILLTVEGNAKVTDFGLSRRTYDYMEYVKKGKEPLPWRWLAIESLQANVFSSKSDVWSYGITMWEIFSLGDTPYPGMEFSLDFVAELAANKLKNTKPQYTNDEIYNLMLKCWHLDPDERPTFSELKKLFQQSLSNGEMNTEVFQNELLDCSSTTSEVYLTLVDTEE